LRTPKVEVVGLTFPIWFIGWLFTIGYVNLTVVKVILALAIWPYYLGVALSAA